MQPSDDSNNISNKHKLLGRSPFRRGDKIKITDRQRKSQNNRYNALVNIQITVIIMLTVTGSAVVV
jgi:hypothetical protein